MFPFLLVNLANNIADQQAIETLLNLAETYGGHASTMASGGVGTVKGAHADNNLQVAETNLKVRSLRISQ